MKILIVSRYHPEETFAAVVGEYLLQNLSIPDVKVVRYTGKPDRGTSKYNLRRFIQKFGLAILPIVLHSDDDLDTDIVIPYFIRSAQEREKILKPLFNFSFQNLRQGLSVIFDIVVTNNAKHSLVDLEFNPRIGLEKAVDLVESFSRYLLNLYLKKD